MNVSQEHIEADGFGCVENGRLVIGEVRNRLQELVRGVCITQLQKQIQQAMKGISSDTK